MEIDKIVDVSEFLNIFRWTKKEMEFIGVINEAMSDSSTIHLDFFYKNNKSFVDNIISSGLIGKFTLSNYVIRISQSLDIIEWFISKGMSLYNKEKGICALSDAGTLPKDPHDRIIKCLLTKYNLEIDPDWDYNAYPQHFSPLGGAVIDGNLKLVQTLLNAGANPRIPTSDGKTPIQHAQDEFERSTNPNKKAIFEKINNMLLGNTKDNVKHLLLNTLNILKHEIKCNLL